jgi:hypothetical protein
MGVRPRAIDLHIEELLLVGFPSGERARIGEAVQAELTRLLATERAPSGVAAMDGAAELRGGSFEVAPGAGPERIGAQVARTVYHGLHR